MPHCSCLCVYLSIRLSVSLVYILIGGILLSARRVRRRKRKIEKNGREGTTNTDTHCRGYCSTRKYMSLDQMGESIFLSLKKKYLFSLG